MKRLRALFAAFSLLLCCFVSGCGDNGSGRSFRFPLDGEPRQLDPQAAADSSSLTLVASLFEGLTRLDADGHVVSGAADWKVSPDGLVYTFTLKESYWSTLSIRGEKTPWDNPVAVTADDFVFGLQRALTPSTGSPAASRLYNIRHAQEVHSGQLSPEELGVEAIEDYVLRITLERPDAQFPAVLATAPCMPCNRDFFAYTAGRYGLEEQHVLTNGAFRLAAWNHGESLLLYKHEDYHAADSVFPEAVRYVITATTSVSALQEGQLDAAPLAAHELEAAQDAGVKTITLRDRVRSVYFNTAVAPLHNTSLRQALRDSIEWQTIYSHLQTAGETPATSYVAPAARLPDGTLYNQPTSPRFSTAVDNARTALGQALAQLYPQETAPSLPTLTVLAADDTVSANLARYLIQSWQKHLKLYAELELVAENELPARLQKKQYQIAVYTTTADGLTGAENLQCYAFDSPQNLTGFSSAEVDTAIQKARAGGQSQLARLESLLTTHCPSLPLSYPVRYYGIVPDTEDIHIYPFGGGSYGAVYEFRQAKKWD